MLGAVAAMNQRREFGPFQCEGGPVRVTRFRSGQLLLDKAKQAGNPQLVIVHAGGGDTASDPRPGVYFNVLGLDRSELPLQEQVVDVDLDVLMVERQTVRAGILEAVFRRIFPHLIYATEPGKEERPAFLQKGEEGFIVRNDLGERPGLEPIMTFENLDEPLGQQQWNLELAVVQTEQGAKQLHLVGDQFRRNAEHMTENEILGGVVAHAIRRRLTLGLKKRIQQAPVELLDDRVAQIGKEIPQVERQFAARLEQVVRQRFQLRILQAEDHHQIGVLTPIPDRTVLGLIGVSEFDRVTELDQVEAAPAKLQCQLLLGQQTIRVRDQGQLADVGYKVVQDGVSPTTHWTPTLFLSEG